MEALLFPPKLLACLKAPGGADDQALLRQKDGFMCPATGVFYPDNAEVPCLLAGEGGGVTTKIKSFYEGHPFPDYGGVEDFGALVSRGFESEVSRSLLEGIGSNKLVLEVGCGTGQLSHFLSLSNNHVLGVDLSTASLRLAIDHARKNERSRVAFVQMDLWSLALRDECFDVVVSTGVLHHTADARAAFANIVRKVKPGGIVVFGLYNSYARIPTGLRALVIRQLGPKIDYVVRSRVTDARKAETWIQDQYFNPHESWHSVDEALDWLKEEKLQYLNCRPPILGTEGEEGAPLFASTKPGNVWQRIVTQLSWIGSIAREGGLFVIAARKPAAGEKVKPMSEPATVVPEVKRYAKTAASAISYTLACIGFAVAVFVGANIAAYYHHRDYRAANATKWSIPCYICGQIIAPLSPEGGTILRNAYGATLAKTIEDAFTTAPYFAPHPTLHYIVAPARNAAYTVGLEGIRYYDGWTDDDVRRVLSQERSYSFMFGGSTTFGHGLTNNLTLPYALNKRLADKGIVYLNLGSQAYDHTREIDKLIYLLRSGYRPRQVIFFDGINDITDMAYSNYRVQDKPIYHGYSAGRGDIRLGFKATNSMLSVSDHLVMFINSLPLYRLWLDMRREPFAAERIKPEKDGFVDAINPDEMEQLFFGWEAFGVQQQSLKLNEIETLYRRGLDLLDHLSRAYGFEYYVFFQPIGYVDPGNPFLRRGVEETPGFKYVRAMEDRVRSLIRSGQINMIDISQELRPLAAEGRAYIDYAHYSPEANQRLAEIMARHILAGQQARGSRSESRP